MTMVKDMIFTRHDYVQSDGSDGEDDVEKIEFYVGQEFVSKEKCKATNGVVVILLSCYSSFWM